MGLRTVLLLIVAILSKLDLITGSEDLCATTSSYSNACLAEDSGKAIDYPYWRMEAPILPNELRVKVYVYDYENSCPYEIIPSGKCRRMYAQDNTLLKVSDLMVRMRFSGSEEWYNAGLAWRVRESNERENDFRSLPGYGYSDLKHWHIYRYFFDESKLQEDKREEWQSKRGEQFKVDFDVKTNCFIERQNECKGFCEGYATQNYTTDAYLGIKGDASTGRLQFEEGSLRVLLYKSYQNFYFIRIVFQRDSNCLDPYIDDSEVSYYMHLYENSDNKNMFRPIIWSHTEVAKGKGEDGNYPKFDKGFHITDQFTQIDMLMRAEPGAEPIGTEASCGNLRKSFIGDIYPEWRKNYDKNLGLAITACRYSPSKGKRYACKDWYTSNKIEWDESLKKKYGISLK